MNYLAKLADALRSLGLLHSDIEKIGSQIETATSEYKTYRDKEQPAPVVTAILHRPQAEIDDEHARETRYETRDTNRLRLETWGVTVGAIVAFATIGQLFLTSRAVRIAAKSATAAQQTVQATKQSIEATIRASQVDQRPWVYVSQFLLNSEPDLNNPPKILISIMNGGKTPALGLTTIYETSSGPISPEPPIPVFKTKEPLSIAILPPNATGFAVTTLPIKSVIEANHLAGYKAGTVAIFVHVKISYSDVFQHRNSTSVCAYHTFAMQLNLFQICTHGNDIGEENP
jgi:hypothetical protein